MATLGRLICEAVVLDQGRDELLRRLAHPFWFQSFGAVMGMDWHSSGITTSVLAALRRGLEPIGDELGVYVCGGRGRASRRTPSELHAVGERTGLDGDALARTSRLVAKVDSAAVHDGFDIYLHGFIVTADGSWTVVQQGMCDTRGQARRYHWLSEDVSSFVDDPHSAIDGHNRGEIINLADARAKRSRQAQVSLANGDPERVVRCLRELTGSAAQQMLFAPPEAVRESAVEPEEAPPLPHLVLPAHHEVTVSDVVLRRLEGTLRATADCGVDGFEGLLLSDGVGRRTVASLAMVSEVIHGAPCRFTDPARFSLAHGGKDGHPFPVPLKVYDRTISVLKASVEKAKLGESDRLAALRQLDHQARLAERASRDEHLDFEALLVHERSRSPEYGGRTVMDDARERATRKKRLPARQPAARRPAARRPRKGTQLKIPGT